MRSFTLFFLFCCIFSQILSRPHGVIEDNDGSEVEEKEYDMEAVAADEDAREDDARNKEQDSSYREEAMQGPNLAASGDRTNSEPKDVNDQLFMQANPDYFSEYKPSKSGRLQEETDTSDANDDHSSLKRTQNTYVDNSDIADRQGTDREVNSNKFDKTGFFRNKQTNKQAQAQDEDSMFVNVESEESNIDNNRYDTNEVQNSNKRTYSKLYSNAADAGDREIVVDENYDNRRYFINRDTRQVKDITQDTENSVQETSNNDLGKIISEDEESVIKRHIRKLSKTDLEELKNSLSDDKKILLKNIIDNIDSSISDNDSINKREITKKAGAIEENSLMDSELSNSIKNQGVTSDLEVSTDSSISQNTKNKETEQSESQTESSSMPTQKSAETNESDKKSGIKSGSVESNLKNKRDTNSADSPDSNESFRDSQFMDSNIQNRQESLNEKECDCSRNEDESSFVGGEPQNEYNTRNQKRQISFEKQADFCDSFKSLEESFPNSNTNDESYSGPLIRVKRKDSDLIVKKRSAGVLPDAKVAYFPYKSENDDEDNDEGNEFDDEGFYDRTSNFAKKNEPLGTGDVDFTKLVSDTNQLDSAETKYNNLKQNSDTHSKLSEIGNLSDEKTNLGSDTDSMLSGVGGADNNLMFISNLREKRTVSDNNPSSTDKQTKSITENNLNPINYQENDAFGPLPRNYEGDLGRYKRIRRLKQLPLLLEEKNFN